MNAENIFLIANTTALLSWIFLAVAPRWKWTQLIVGEIIILLLAAAYLILVVLFFGQAEGGFSSLPDVMKLFTNKNVALAGWIHYLAFDLFVGVWETRDAREKGISHWFVLPCLFLTFMFGPIGFLAYYGLRLIARRKNDAKGEAL
ncbi:MAG: ABA4-like family protein [Acidobacteriota bacterium]|nr:ABA4-like family protein [Acidobacteriota bacterium]